MRLHHVFQAARLRYASGALLTFTLLAACVSGAPRKPSGGTSDLITRVELSRSLASNAFDAVRQLRPSMLVGRGRTTITGQDLGVIVYLDEKRLGTASQLRDLAVSTIYEIRFVSATAAQIKWGNGHPHGVISVTSLRALEPVR